MFDYFFFRNALIFQLIIFISVIGMVPEELPKKHRIVNRDGQEFEVAAASIVHARTLANAVGDLPHANDAIPDCTGHDHSLFLQYLPCAKEIAKRKKNELVLAHESIQNLAAIATSADYYESPDILKKSTSLLVQQLRHDEGVRRHFAIHGTFHLPKLAPLVTQAVIKKYLRRNPAVKMVLFKEQQIHASKDGELETVLLPYEVWNKHIFTEEKYRFLNKEKDERSFSGWLDMINMTFVNTTTEQVIPLQEAESLGRLVNHHSEYSKPLLLTLHLINSSESKYVFALWNIQTGRQLQKWEFQTGKADLIDSFWTDYCSDDRVIVHLLKGHGTLRAYDQNYYILGNKNPKITILNPHEIGARCTIRFDPDKSLLIAGSSKGEVDVWETDTFTKCTNFLDHHDGGVTSVVFHPTKRNLFASAGADKQVKIWNLERSSATLTGFNNPIWTLAFNNEGDLLACGAKDGIVHVCSVPLQVCLHSITNHQRPSGGPVPVSSLSFSPDDTVLVSYSFLTQGLTTLVDKDVQKAVQELPLDCIGFLEWVGKQILEKKQITAADMRRHKNSYTAIPAPLHDVVRNQMSFAQRAFLKYEDLKKTVL